MSRVIKSFLHAAKVHFRSITHVISFTLVIIVLSKEMLAVFHVLSHRDMDTHELLLALAGAADSLHSFISDFAEFFVKSASEIEEG